MGFLMDKIGDSNPDLVRMDLITQNWDTVLWIVTHVDLHRTAKVQAFPKENRDVFE